MENREGDKGMAKIIFKDGTEKSCEIIKEYETSAIIRTFDVEYYRTTVGKFEKLGASVDSRLTTTLLWDRVFDVAGIEK